MRSMATAEYIKTLRTEMFKELSERKHALWSVREIVKESKK